MDFNDPTVLVAALLLLLLIAVAATVLHRRSESRRLRQRFGPEYGRAVTEHGSPAKAEAELRAREKRVQRLTLHPLSPADATRFASSWRALQSRFVDDPRSSVVEADRLVRQLMEARGYPMQDFDRLAADISVDHPRVVDNYRAARIIAERNQRNQTSTEDLRRAVVHYRTLFEDLLEEAPQAQPEQGHFGMHKNLKVQ